MTARKQTSPNTTAVKSSLHLERESLRTLSQKDAKSADAGRSISSTYCGCSTPW